MAPGGYKRTTVATDTFGYPAGSTVDYDPPCRDSQEVEEEAKRERDEAYRRQLEQARRSGKTLKW